eukprot:13696938-Alexandrium_andersonii.AAC.1
MCIRDSPGPSDATIRASTGPSSATRRLGVPPGGGKIPALTTAPTRTPPARPRCAALRTSSRLRW